MTTNKTSEAVEKMLQPLIEAGEQYGTGSFTYQQILSEFEPMFPAFFEKYQEMDKALQWLLENGNPNSKQLLVIKSALACDPLAE